MFGEARDVLAGFTVDAGAVADEANQAIVPRQGSDPLQRRVQHARIRPRVRLRMQRVVLRDDLLQDLRNPLLAAQRGHDTEIRIVVDQRPHPIAL